MPTQLSLLDRAWVNEQAPVVLARVGGCEFSTDDVHGLVTEQPANRKLYGVLFAKLKAEKWIERVGYRPSQRPEANGRVVAVWRVRRTP